MTEAEWLACDRPVDLLYARRSTASERKVRLCACACSRLVWSLLEDDRSRRAVEVAERFADGLGPDAREREEAYDAAMTLGDEIAANHAGQRSLAIAHAAAGAAAALWTMDFNMVFHAVGDLVANSPNATRPLALVRDIFGNPFRPPAFSAQWRTSTALSLAAQMYESRDFSPMPILADALQDAGCEDSMVDPENWTTG